MQESEFQDSFLVQVQVWPQSSGLGLNDCGLGLFATISTSASSETRI